jgi:hypothetical protein
MGRTTIDRRTALLAGLAALLVCLGLALALLPKDWIEGRFEVEPDGGDGSFELLLALIPICLGLALGAIAALRWRAVHRTSRHAGIAPATTRDRR